MPLFKVLLHLLVGSINFTGTEKIFSMFFNAVVLRYSTAWASEGGTRGGLAPCNLKFGIFVIKFSAKKVIFLASSG